MGAVKIGVVVITRTVTGLSQPQGPEIGTSGPEGIKENGRITGAKPKRLCNTDR